jgi:hypothetical protein
MEEIYLFNAGYSNISKKLTKVVSTGKRLGDGEVDSLQPVRWESNGCTTISHSTNLVDLEPEDTGK